MDRIQQLFEEIGSQSYPPVDSWNPDVERDVDIRIDVNGDWFYQGSPIQRPEMVRLFSSVLTRQGERYSLVTPVEKLNIQVEDVPFIACTHEHLLDSQREIHTFETNVQDRVIVSLEHPLTVEVPSEGHGVLPYVLVRKNLLARLSRAVYYRVAEYCVEYNGQLGIWSDGDFFPMSNTE